MVGTANEDDENTLENVSLEEEVGGIGFKQHKKIVHKWAVRKRSQGW